PQIFVSLRQCVQIFRDSATQKEKKLALVHVCVDFFCTQAGWTIRIRNCYRYFSFEIRSRRDDIVRFIFRFGYCLGFVDDAGEAYLFWKMPTVRGDVVFVFGVGSFCLCNNENTKTSEGLPS